MTIPTRLAISVFVALVFVGGAFPQDAKDKYSSEEDARLAKLIERWIKLNESERDHVAREVARGGEPKLPDDFNKWFTQLGGNEDGWDRTRIQRGSVREIFDRIAWRLEATGPILSHEQFIHYAKEFWRKDKSPLWGKPPAFDTDAEAISLFRRLDRDRDGYLSGAEMSPDLRAKLKHWDKNNDGWINVDEYRFYFAHRLDAIYGEKQQRSEVKLPVLPITAPNDAERPMVMRAGNLPVGLPAWFDPLDTDHDGQVALYEWRRAGWTLDEFQKLDGNDDGFLEPREILKLLSIAERDGSRPYGYLMQKRIGEAKAASGK